MDFEWDPVKAESNLRKHGVAFAKAAQIFHDFKRVEMPDDSDERGEDHWIVIGRIEP